MTSPYLTRDELRALCERMAADLAALAATLPAAAPDRSTARWFDDPGWSVVPESVDAEG